jgi:hypothetical protein
MATYGREDDSLEHVKLFIFPVVILAREAVLESEEYAGLGIVTVSCTRGLFIFVSVTSHDGRKLRISFPNLQKSPSMG